MERREKWVTLDLLPHIKTGQWTGPWGEGRPWVKQSLLVSPGRLNKLRSEEICTRLTWEHEDEELEVEVVGGPGGGLVLGDGGDDWDVVLRIGRVQQGVETSRPRGDFPWGRTKAF